MKKYAFDLATEGDLILLPVLLNDYEVALALDTAATQNPEVATLRHVGRLSNQSPVKAD